MAAGEDSAEEVSVAADSGVASVTEDSAEVSAVADGPREASAVADWAWEASAAADGAWEASAVADWALEPSPEAARAGLWAVAWWDAKHSPRLAVIGRAGATGVTDAGMASAFSGVACRSLPPSSMTITIMVGGIPEAATGTAAILATALVIAGLTPTISATKGSGLRG